MYLVIPILAFILIIFDNQSIFRALQFIVILPLLYFLRFLNIKFGLKYFLSIGLILFAYYVLNPNWMQFYKNHELANEVNLKNNKLLDELELKDSNQKPFKFKQGETYLLDFWNTRCASCFDGMEKLRKWSNANPKNNNILLVNVLIKGEDFTDNNLLVEKYNFMSVYTKLSASYLKELGVKEYPTHIIIKDNKISFIGRVSTKPQVLNNNINDFFD